MRKYCFLLAFALAFPAAHFFAADNDAPTAGATPAASATPFPLPKSMTTTQKKKPADVTGPTKISGPYDKNQDGILEADEILAVRKDFAADPNGPLKQFDINHDGILDDEEIARIPLPRVKTAAKKKTSSTGSKLLGGSNGK